MIQSVPGRGEGNKETLCLTHTQSQLSIAPPKPPAVSGLSPTIPPSSWPRPNTDLSTVHFQDLLLSQTAFTGNAHCNASLHYVCAPTHDFIFGHQPYSTHSLGFALGCYSSWWYHLHLSGRPSIDVDLLLAWLPFFLLFDFGTMTNKTFHEI